MSFFFVLSFFYNFHTLGGLRIPIVRMLYTLTNCSIMHACISHTPRAGLNPSSVKINVNTIAKHPPSVSHPGGKNCIRNCFRLYMSSIINYYNMQHLPQRVAQLAWPWQKKNSLTQIQSWTSEPSSHSSGSYIPKVARKTCDFSQLVHVRFIYSSLNLLWVPRTF